MGLDIHVRTTKQEEEDDRSFEVCSLSRTFGNFLSRGGVIEGEPELDQIGRMTGLDIAPLYEMENYPNESLLADELAYAADDEERAHIRNRVQADKAKLSGNLDSILGLVDQLITALSARADWLKLLDHQGYDTLNSEHYFAQFTHDPGDGYLGNNFGQDLRKLRHFLRSVKQQDHTTVFFEFG